MHSCIYQGMVRHQRLLPVAQRFQYRTWMVYLDLEELPSLHKRLGLLSPRRFSPLSFLRTDHLGDAATPLIDWVRTQVHAETGMQLNGPVRLLTQLRQWGQYFSPLNLYYCWNQADDEIVAILAEVSNIPWGEKHVYCLWEGNRTLDSLGLSFEHAKEFHVSPFMGMEQTYVWSLQSPAQQLRIELGSREADVPLFRAVLEMQRVELSSWSLAWQMARQPLPAWQIVAGIYYQAFKLWWKQCPVYPHPGSSVAARQKSA